MTIGTKIRNLRDEKCWSQSELAVKLSIGQTTLGCIESGETKKIDFMLMDKICKEFNIDSDYFKETNNLNQINNDNAVGYIENQTINNLSKKLIELYELHIKDLKEKNICLEIQVNNLQLENNELKIR